MYSCPSNLCMSIAIYCLLTVGTRVGLVCVCVRACVRVIQSHAYSMRTLVSSKATVWLPVL